MGSKGSNTTTTNQSQSQTYTPNPQAAGYITNALQQGANVATLPFNIPQAPVAGFSPDQFAAFQGVRNAQGQAQPYYNQAANYFSPQGAQAFANPYIDSVTANLKDIFGQQNTQTTGQLTQAAGGVGADRIAVGQSELAKQQGLAAGQTYSQLYQNAAQQAQAAGYGMANLGQASQNSAFQGANQLLGTGGLQQQLTQAQLNAPYQQQLAASAFPYQQAQFLAGITGALAPGLGGTTAGVSNGQTTGPSPSIWSQLLGGGLAAAGGLGASGAFGSNGWLTGATQPSVGATYGGYDAGGNSLGSGSYGGVNYKAFADGGDVGGDSNPYPVADSPIDVSQHSIIPQVQLQPIQAHQPQLQFSQPQAQSGSGGGGKGSGVGDLIGSAAKIGAMFLAQGGTVGNRNFDGFNPQAFADGGSPDDAPASFDERFPYRMAGTPAMDTWRSGVDNDLATGATAQNGGGDLPGVITAGTKPPMSALAFAAPEGYGNSAIPLPRARPDAAGPRIAADDSALPDNATPTEGRGNPYARPATAPPAQDDAGQSFIKSPWAALTAAGLGIMGGTSPFAGVNIGQGGMQGLKTLEQQRADALKDQTAQQAAKRLAQEAQFHEDQYSRLTAYQKAQMEKEKWTPVGSLTTGDGQLHPAAFDQASGRLIDLVTGKPPETDAKFVPKDASKTNPEVIKHLSDGIESGRQPPITTGLYAMAPHVKAELEARGFDLAKAQMEWKRAEKQVAALNGPQMQKFVGLAHSVDSTIDEANRLAKELQNSGVPFLNALKLKALIQTEGNSPKGQLATQYMTTINTLKEEFANLAQGGYAPTEAAWKLANEQINGNFGMEQLGASLNQVQRLVRYRLQAIPGMATSGPGAANRYTGQQGAGVESDPITQARAAIAGGAPRQAVIDRLIEKGIDPAGLGNE